MTERIRSRPYVWQPVPWSDQRVLTRGNVDGLPALGWGRADRAELATARQLRALGLRPAGAEPVAVLVFGHRRPGRRPVEHASLYRIADAAPKRTATPAQREAIDKALAARRTCRKCGEEQDYYLSTVSRMCGPCAEATGFGDDHDQERAAEGDTDADGWRGEHESAMRAEDAHRPVTNTDLADTDLAGREVANLTERDVDQPAQVGPVAVPAQRTAGTDRPSPVLATGADDARAVVADPAADRDDETTRVVERARRAVAQLAQRRTPATPQTAELDRARRLTHWHADDQAAERTRELEGSTR